MRVIAEQVYFMELAAGPDDHTLVLLSNADGSRGVSIRFDLTYLPCFSLWKNTVGEADGYVTGLEPATNFPNPHRFEKSKGRVAYLASRRESHPVAADRNAGWFKRSSRGVDQNKRPLAE